MDPASAAYVVSGALRLTGVLDASAFRFALDGLVSRHEALRTRFEERDGVAWQVVDAAPHYAWSEHDLSGLAEADREAELAGRLHAAGQAAFDLAQGPVLRAALIRLGPEEHVLSLAMHHIVSDGWSIGILLRELLALYEAARQDREAGLAPLPIQYGDYALWQREWLEGGALEAQLAYWRQRLGNEHPVLELPVDHVRQGARGSAGGRVERAVPPALAEALRQMSRAEGVTLFMTLLAAFDVLLYRYSGQSDLRVGVPVANRNRVETEGLIGFFVNTLVLRADVSGAQSFRDLLQQVRERMLEAQANQDLPFERLVAELQPERQVGRNPLVQVKFLLQEAWGQIAPSADLSVEAIDTDQNSVHFDLSVDVIERAGMLDCQFTYAVDLFESATVGAFADTYIEILSGIVQHPNISVGTIKIANEPSAATDISIHSTSLLSRLSDVTERRGGDMALVWEDGCLDWSRLWDWSGRLAGRLRALGVGAGSVVALALPRGPALVASLLAVWRAGGAYVPLDTTLPDERLVWQMGDSGARWLIAKTPVGRLPQGVTRVAPDEAGEAPTLTLPHPGQAAYIIYTSGSTGRPKGVVVSHGALSSYVQAVLMRLPEGIGSAAYVSTPAADLGHTVLFGALWAGWTLHLISEDRAFDPDSFAAYMRAQQIDLLKIVPSHLSGLLQAADAADVLPEQCLILGGEATSAPLAARIAALKPGCRVVNHYGPTETTVGVLTREGTATAEPILPLGLPLAQARAYVLDADGNPVPPGGIGEICVGGASLAQGYLNRPGQTADRFAPDPFGAPGERLYRTGDRGRRLADGEIVFLGRQDDQVKIRGYRVEPQEVTAQLRSLPGVAEAIVIARPDAQERLRLLGYVTGEALDPAKLREGLARVLPDYMLPSAIQVLEKLPLTRNGKIDRNALPEPGEDGQRVRVAPSTETEAQLLSIWQAVLGRDDIGVTDNFFEAGGDSILSLQVIAKARQAGLRLTPRQVFENPTIQATATLATPVTLRRSIALESTASDFLMSGLDQAGLERLGLGSSAVQDIYPATALQQGLLFHGLLRSGQGIYVNQLRLTLSGALDRAALRGAWEDAVARHDILRTHFDWRHGGEALQVVHRQVSLPWREEDWSGLTAAAYEAELSAWRAADLAQGFDLGVAPLMRLALFARPDRGWDLIWTNHHVLTDGWSSARLLSEIVRSYEARRAG
ncbi:MAG TPA: amino acid adenylation domain-containing protein, partial [Rhodopila sp.]